MEDKRFQVLTAPKVAGVSIQDITGELEAQYPAYKVEVHEANNEFVAKLVRKAAPPKGKVPPFLDEEDDDAEAPADIAPKDDEDAPDADDSSEDDADDKPKPSKKDDADKDDADGDGEGGGDLAKALKALDTLKTVLPHLEKQLKTLGGGDMPEGLGAGPLGPDDMPGGPGGPGAPVGPSQSDLDAVGPTPGHPTPGNAAPVVPGLGGKGPHPPHPQVGVPTFGHVKQNKFVYRPAFNEDGTQVSMEEATREIAAHPRYAKYDVKEVRFDDDGQQYVAHLKLRQE